MSKIIFLSLDIFLYDQKVAIISDDYQDSTKKENIMETVSKSKNPIYTSNGFADFEGIESRFNKILSTDQYHKLCNIIASSKKIYVIANGGLHYVGSHMATDLTRLSLIHI